jgi:cytochrome c biogenesis protein CcdA
MAQNAATTGDQRLIRRLPVLCGVLLGGLWFLAFHYRFHQGTESGAEAILGLHPALLQRSPPAFLVAFTVGSAAVWMPCIMQMVLVFSGVGAGMTGRFRGRWFFAGYVGVYVALGGLAAMLGGVAGRLQLAGLLQVVGGVAVAFIGLHLLGALRGRFFKPCGSAIAFALRGGRLHRLGRASTGAAFAIYCAGCCGPLLYPLFVFSVASGSWLVGAAVAGGFALAMALPVGVLGALGRESLTWVGRVVNNYDLVSRSAGAALVTLGVLLVLTQPLVLLVTTAHR